MRAQDIRLSYTNPITGCTEARSNGRQYVEIDGIVLVVNHYYRSRTPDWSARAYTDHLDSTAVLEWAKAGNALGFGHVRRRDLLEQIAASVGTQEWQQKRDALLAIPRT
ncbi:hypothetical protein [Streptomyces sp. AS02]|uniref:hypothetical protein n=1 Tax=Streptomyces sp. AS02 TaxID=2938946 RepID=UPI0020227D49|nr:hypothetical protein [Streptomyces sp. AS02]MCL8016950.1 hypothetical protein [Streptomyces sp. AS02]